MGHSQRIVSRLAIGLCGFGMLCAQAADAADRVNLMMTFRQGEVQPWQVRPGVTIPVFGNATDAGAKPGDGTANGDSYAFSFSANPNLQVITDGSLSGTVSNDRYIVENVSFVLLNGSTREGLSVTLTVDDGAGSVDAETREIDIVDPTDPISDTPLENLSIDVNIAIQNGLRALYLQQQSNGRWRHGSVGGTWDCATTGFTIWAFANSGHLPIHDFNDDIYAEVVQGGVDFILSQASIQTPVNQANIGSPDGDGNSRMISLCGPNGGNAVGYATPIAAAGVIASYSAAPETLVGSGALAGESYRQVIQDAIDWIAFGQQDSGSLRGGWRYNPNGGADTSADSWSYVAQEGFEAVFEGSVLELVKQEAERRINSSQSQGPIGDRGQFGYTGTAPIAFDGNATTAGGLSGLVMVTVGGRIPPLLDGGPLSSSIFPDAASRKAAAIAHLGLRWDAPGGVWAGNRNNFYAMWTTARALRLNGTEVLVDRNGVTFDWETGEDSTSPGVLPPPNSVHEGYFPFLVRTQAADGAWNATVNAGNWTRALNTAWGVLILQPTVFGPPPVANRPPVALCQDPGLFTDFGACTADASVDAGSFDPEGGDLSYMQEPPGPYSPVETTVTLTVEDPDGQSASCEATVTVTDPEPPQISCNAPALISGEAGASYSFTATASDNCGPDLGVTVEVATATCVDDDGDDDGVPDDQDECPDSDLSDVVVISECITGVFNVLFPSGCTISDRILACGTEVSNHGEFVSCVSHLTNELKSDSVITGREKGAIEVCAAQAPIPPDHPGGGSSLRSAAGKEELCEVTTDGATVSFPSGPSSGLLSWTATATDGLGNTTSQDCTVVIQDPDTPLPNLPPTADAGDDRVVQTGVDVTLDGSGSSDLNGDPITYLWELIEVPTGSLAVFDDPTAVQPTFVPDLSGVYTAQLVVNDGQADSAPDTVSVVALNHRPMASAGPDRTAFLGDTVTLDGSGSMDPEGRPLTYTWTLAFVPEGSAAVLDDPTSATPSFEADVRGPYVAQLVVNDGELSSLVDAVIIRVVNRAPVADAGPDQEISVFDTVLLDGSGSFDGDGDPITYAWSFTSKPAGSTAALDDATSVTPSFFADLAGTYVLELVVNDGFDDSAPDAVSIVTVNTPPVANAGPDQTAFLGDTVQLDGTGSFDIDGDVLTFQWTILNRPAGSMATLSDATSPQPTFVVDARGVYDFQLVVSDGQRSSRQPDTVRVTVPNRPPTADAGPDQTAFLGQTVQLDGTGSSDPDDDPLTYAWSFAVVPAGSTAVLSDPTSPQPTFVPDRRGTYVVRLVVNDGFDPSAPDTVTITVPNQTPVADAGPDQNVFVTDTVLLDGSGSFDPDGDALSYAWSLVSVPPGSIATLSDPTVVNPTFVVDAPGIYVVELVVSDGFESSAPDTVTITTVNSPPVADAGPDQEALPDDTVQLDGSGSFDVDGDALTYSWSFLAVPPGSTAVLSDPTAVNPTFVLDVAGAYLVQLVVNDGMVDSAPDTVSIATGNVAPVADAGPDQTVFVGDTVQLDGSGSFDANGDALTYLWSFVSVPDGSLATLPNPTAVHPTFEVDVFGTYVVQLVVNDGEFDSAPDTVTITTQNSQPVADAGPDQVVLTGSLVQLDGSGSFDVDGDALTYSWSLLTVPNGSTAALSDPTAVDPTFVADVVGVYVVQLIVNDGELDSVADTVMIEASDDVAVVPDVVGLDQSEAEAAIVAEDLVVGNVTQAPSNTVPAGQVISQDPAGGTAVAGGSAVDLVVSVGFDPAPRLRASLDRDPPIYASGELAELTILTDDDAGVPVVTVEFDGVSVPVILPVTLLDTSGLSPGSTHTVLVTASDSVGTTVSETLSLVIADPADTTPPAVQITAPPEDAVLSSALEILGTASDANLAGFDLAYSPVGANEFVIFAEGSSSIEDGVLGTIDPTLLPNDMYEIRLRAFDANQSAAVTRVVRVDGQRKVGNFTVSFNDIVLPLAGIPITITRTYDSRIKTQQDFGVGWTLGVTQGEYSNNRTPGLGWQILPSGGIFSLPCRVVTETLSHVTEIRLSDAEAFFFRLDLVNPAPTLGGCFVTPRFVPLAGNLSAQLLIIGNADLFYQTGSNEVVTLEDFEPFEPTDVQLITPDGRIIDLNLNRGITSARDTNGVGIFIGPNGVTHTGGSGISFQRDSRGRIIRITRPDGEFLEYTYDAFGDLVQVTDAEGATSEFGYDSDHFLTDISDGRGVPLIRNEYDADGRLVATTDADGNRIEFEHDLPGNREIYRDRLGNLQIFQYDAAGNVTARTDELGNTTTSAYDSDGNLLSETDPLGNTRTMTYDAAGNVLSETDPLGNTKSTTYTTGSLPLTETDELGNTTTHGYDADGNRITTTDSLGNTTTFTRDSAGNPLTVTDALGFVTSRVFDSDGQETSFTDAEGNTTSKSYDANGNLLSESRTRTVGGAPVAETKTFVYDAEGRVVSQTDEAGATVLIEYDAVGLISARTDALGNRTEFSYTFAGKPLEVRHPDGTTEAFEYDAEGRKIASTDRAGRRTEFVRDASGRIVETRHPDGAVERVSYDAAGRKVSETDANGNTTTFGYDASGRNTSVTDALGNVTQFSYDAAGRKISQTDAKGNTTSFEYDANGNLTRKVFPDGTDVTFTYDAVGNNISETDQADNATSFAYDGLGRVIRVTDAIGGVTSYGYDEVGNRTSITDANGNTTTFEYDAKGRETLRVLPGGQEFASEYDDAGNLVRTVDANGQEILFEYDTNHRLIRRTLPGGTVEEITYTPTGQIASQTDARGVTTFAFDARDRLIRPENPDGTSLTYTYDAAGNRTSVATPSGVTTFTYDALNRLASTRAPDGGLTTYTYDAVGNLVTTAYPNGTSARYTYDSLNRLGRLENQRSDGTVITAYDYTLGPAGNRTRIAESSGRVVDYGYDAVYRLTQEVVSGVDPTTRSYTYDAVGNRLSRTVEGVTTNYTYDANDRLLMEGTTSYTYDANGNVATRTEAGVTTAYSYDPLNRMIRAVEGSETVEVTYDMDGNRVRRSVNGLETRYLVDANRAHAQVLEERDGVGALVALYVHGLDLISQRRGGTTSFYHYDGLGSVRALTDSAETVTDTYDYEAFGELLSSTGTTPNEFLFTGEQFDPNVGFYYLRARWYDPSVGRFTTPDVFPPNLFDPETLHRYVYVVNNPVNMIDPSGQFGTLAGLMTTVSIGQILSAMQPTLVTGTIIYVGVQAFFKPGFELRNLAIEMMLLPPPNAEGWEEALRTYQNGALLIQLGAFFIDSANDIANIAQAGLGVAKFAKALLNVPRTTLTVVEITRIQRFESIAISIETQGLSLFSQVQRSSSITLVRTLTQQFTDWSKVISTGIGALRRIQKVVS